MASRYIAGDPVHIKNPLNPYTVQKTQAETLTFFFDASAWLKYEGRTISSVAVAVTAGTGTAPTFVGGSNKVWNGTTQSAPGTSVSWRLAGGNSATWNGNGTGALVLTLTLDDATTVAIPVTVVLKEAI
jgi:hypothetical protein